MSIISDLKSLFNNSTSNEFIIYEYDESDPASHTKSAFEIYGVLSINRNQINTIPDVPLEGGQFRQDSQNIKPYQLTIDGGILSNPYSNQEISNIINKIKGYLNGITLLSVFNSFTFEKFYPLKLNSFKYSTRVEQTIPIVSLIFTQIQIGAPSVYSTNQIVSPSNPANLPKITNQS